MRLQLRSGRNHCSGADWIHSFDNLASSRFRQRTILSVAQTVATFEQVITPRSERAHARQSSVQLMHIESGGAKTSDNGRSAGFSGADC